MDSEEEYLSFPEDQEDDDDSGPSEEDIRFEEDQKNDNPNKDSQYPSEALGIDEIVQYMMDQMKDTSSVLRLPGTVTRILLSHFKWDQEQLFEAFFNTDQKKLFAEAQITYDPHKQDSNLDSDTDCSICFQPLPNDHQLFSLECGHHFCDLCWDEYLTRKIMDEGRAQSIQCAGHKCSVFVGDETVMALLKNQRVKAKYQSLITKSFVECNRLLKWCPNPNCENAIRVQYTKAAPVKCRCAHTFCFKCEQNWHDPVDCDTIKEWITRISGDIDTVNWIKANTRNCPKCNTTIEKNRGCNIMTCTKDNCKTWFCWFCLQSFHPFAPHAYTCTNYQTQQVQSVLTLQKDSKTNLDRFLFFSERYANYYASLKMEKNLYSVAEKKMSELISLKNMSWIESQFMRRAVDTLCSCRQALMYSYVFTFYFESDQNNQYLIFKSNRGDLENAVEWLSMYLESDLSGEKLNDIQQKVTDKYLYCESRRKVLLEHVHEGYEKNWWKRLDKV